ncbi:hypothetical protein RND71_027538 [Anisodus tanguticus]|uniref:Pentatricopeptide repeat-containing protein n=1 Tax=Anisodus tanguticus TaxID=243964 RepID=A0AAE1RI42_9SOLA|nr:hypothetical protein RND71_027538 [Anisodus tanguticus]
MAARAKIANHKFTTFELLSHLQRRYTTTHSPIVHILSKARLFDEARFYLSELLELSRNNKKPVSFVWDELVAVYREFKFSPTVFYMVLRIYAKKGLFKNALYVFDNMPKWGIVHKLGSCNSLVKKDGKVDKPEIFVEEIEKMGLELSIATYHSLINGYVEKKDFKGVESVWRVNRRVLSNGKMDDALRIRDEMLRSGFKMNLFICNSLINGYCKAGKISNAEQVVRSMTRWNLKPDSYSYHTLLDGYCREGLIQNAFNLCDEMIHNGINPTVVTYNTLLNGLCREGAIVDAMHLWNLMLTRGVVPNAVGYGTLLDAFLNMGEFEKALVLWKHILARGHTKSRILLNTVLKGFCKMWKMVVADLLFNKMEELGCSPDGVTYRTLSDGYCNAGEIEKALKMKDTMELQNIPSSIENFNSLISGLIKAGKFSKVEDLLSEMNDRELTPNIVTYGALIAGWFKELLPEKAFKAYSEMREKGLNPNVIIVSSIISGLYKLGRTDDANIFLQKILDCHKSVVPYNVLYNIAVAGLCKLGKFDDARDAIKYKLLLTKRLYPRCGISLVGKVNEAFNLRDEMLIKDIVPNIAVYNALINGLCKAGNTERALRLFSIATQNYVSLPSMLSCLEDTIKKPSIGFSPPPKVVMELLVGRNDPLGSEIESHILAIEGSSVYSPVESIKCLEVGLKDYVRKQVGTRAGSEYHLIMKLELCKMLSAQCGQDHY